MKALIRAHFAKTIHGILETAEILHGQDPQWAFYRKALLRELNNLQREIEEIWATGGAMDDYDQRLR